MHQGVAYGLHDGQVASRGVDGDQVELGGGAGDAGDVDLGGAQAGGNGHDVDVVEEPVEVGGVHVVAEGDAGAGRGAGEERIEQ